MDFYDLLDVPRSATSDQIRANYRILVQLFHPDRLQHVNAAVRAYAEERLKRINAAYSVLADATKRAKYDYETGYRSERPESAETPAQRKRRQKTRYPDDPEPMYAHFTNYNDEDIEEWIQQEMNRRAYAEAEYRSREAQEEALRQQRDVEARARRAAASNLPRVQLDGERLTLQLTRDLSTTLIRIPDSEFLVGSDPARDPDSRPDEQPQHPVDLGEYFIGQFPVTNAQYQIFKDATEPRKFGETTRSAGWQCPPGKENHPVVNISWDDATAFCMWLSQETGCIFRLPTEAEWEKAARGADGRIFPWGDTWDANKANAGETHPGTTPVGQFSPQGNSPYGLSDMSGNVWEWCADRYDEKEYRLRKRLARNPFGPEGGEGNVVRGGAFDKGPRHARCAQRNWYYPFNRRRDVGFRAVAEPF